MSDYRAHPVSRRIWLIDEPEPGIGLEAPRMPQEPSEPRRTEYHPTRNAVARKREGRRERMRCQQKNMKLWGDDESPDDKLRILATWLVEDSDLPEEEARDFASAIDAVLSAR